MNNKKTLNLVTLAGIFCSSIIISNILAFKTWTLFGFTLPAAVIIFPIAYIVNDALAELYDYDTVSRVIKTGFVMNLIAVIVYNIAIVLPSSPFFDGQLHFEKVLSTSLRVFMSSLTAYLVGSYINLKVMNFFKIKDGKNKLAFRCILSTLLGEGIDTLLFITLAFIGTMPLDALMLMVIGQVTFKVGYEILAYPLTRIIIKKLKG